jgi:hypothetical protein
MSRGNRTSELGQVVNNDLESQKRSVLCLKSLKGNDHNIWGRAGMCHDQKHSSPGLWNMDWMILEEIRQTDK